jgi:hypothetical protein
VVGNKAVQRLAIFRDLEQKSALFVRSSRTKWTISDAAFIETYGNLNSLVGEPGIVPHDQVAVNFLHEIEVGTSVGVFRRFLCYRFS